jgi:hypothetical protein
LKLLLTQEGKRKVVKKYIDFKYSYNYLNGATSQLIEQLGLPPPIYRPHSS